MKVTRRNKVRKFSHDDAISIAPSKAKSKRIGRASPPLRDITDRKLAEEALRESEAKYRTLVDQSLEGIAIAQGPPPRLVFANPAMAKILGYTPDELTSLSPKETEGLVHPEDRAAFFDRFKDRLQGKPAPPRYEVRGIRKDGEVRWFEVSSNRIEYQGQPAEQATFVDITDRKLMEEMLEVERVKLKESFENLPLLAYNISHDGTINDCNRLAVSTLGYSGKEELVGKPLLTTVYAPPSREKAEKLFQKWKQTGKLKDEELQIITKQGRILDVLLNVDTIYDKNGKPLYTISTQLDITEYKRMEEDRDHLFNLSVDMLCIAGFDGYFKRLNPAWEKTFGWTSQELMSKPYLDFVHPDDRERTINKAQDLAEGNAVITFDNRYLCKDSTYKWISWSAVPFAEEQLIYAVARDVTERKQMEGRMLESEEKFRALFENATDGILIADVDTKNLILGNKAISQMLGYSQEEIKNLRVMDISTEKDLPHVLDVFEKAARLEITGASNFPLKRREGTVTFADVSVFFVTVAGKKLMAGFFRDITERKQAEETLRVRTRELGCLYGISTLVEQVETDLDRILKGVISLIPSAWQYPHITCARIVFGERTFESSNFKETLWKQSAPIRVQKKNAGSVEVCYLEEKPLLFEGPFLREERDLINAIAERLARTIERVEAEEALRDSEARIRSIVDTAVDGVIAIDGSGIIQSFNPAAEHLFGYKPEEVVGQNVKILMPEPYHSEHDGYISNYLRTGKAKIIGIGREVVARRKDGATFPIDLAVGEVKTTDAKHMFTGIIRDITERKRMEKMKDQFISAVTHELRTPLGPLMVHVEYVLSGKLGPVPEKIESSLQAMKRSTDRLANLTNELLDISRLEAGKFQLNPQPLDLREILSQCIEEMQPTMDSKQQHLHYEAPERPLNVHADPVRLSQVVTNLLSNASKCTPEQGHITLKVDQGANFEVHVSDTGIGLRKEDLLRVFERFANIEKPTHIKGAGLGLSLTKGLVEAHGGKIWVESDGEGKGATFTFTLPRLR